MLNIVCKNLIIAVRAIQIKSVCIKPEQTRTGFLRIKYEQVSLIHVCKCKAEDQLGSCDGSRYCRYCQPGMQKIVALKKVCQPAVVKCRVLVIKP